MEPTLRLTQVLKQEAEDIGLQGKDIAEYVTRQQNLDREERAAWRVAQKFHAEEKKRADEIRLAEIAAEAEEKKRADEIKVQMAQIEVDRELKLKELELQAQQAQTKATISSAATPPPRNKDAKSPKLPSFIDEKDELDSYLLCFERYAENASWEKDTWAIKLNALLTGRAMDVYTRMSDVDASNYDKLKKALLTRYNYTEDGYRKDSEKLHQRLKKQKRADQKKTIQPKPDSSQGCQRSLQCYRCRGFGNRQSECGTEISPGKDQKGSSTPVRQSSQKKTRAMVAQLEVEVTRSRRNSKKSGTEGSTNSDRAVYSAVCRAQSNDGQTYVGVGKLNGRPVKVLHDTGCTGMIVDRALVPEVMVIPGSSGWL